MEIGVDIVEMARLKNVSRHFIERVLTNKELAIYDLKSDEQKLTYLAGRFAGKEAVSKAMGTGIGKIGFQDIEILNDSQGKPYLNIERAKISLSHEKNYAIAFVVID